VLVNPRAAKRHDETLKMIEALRKRRAHAYATLDHKYDALVSQKSRHLSDNDTGKWAENVVLVPCWSMV
jgi:ribosomal protein L15E